MLTEYYANSNRLIQSSEFWFSSNPLIDFEDPISEPTDGTANSLIGSIVIKSSRKIFIFLNVNY
jgi:hypothetical protein